MTRLIRLTSINNDPQIGAFAIEFPSGACKSVQWQSAERIGDTLTAAKKYASECLQTCLDEQRIDDAERTNWASVTAAIQRIIGDWNDALTSPPGAR